MGGRAEPATHERPRMPYPAELEVEIERMKQSLLSSWDASQQEHQAELAAIRKELTREYEERAQLSQQCQALDQELAALKLRLAESQAQMVDTVDDRVLRQLAEKEVETLAAKVRQLEEELARSREELVSVRHQLHLEAEQSSKLTLEIVDIKLAQEAELRRLRGLNASPPQPNLPDLVPEEKELDESQQIQRLAYEDPVTGLPNFHLGERFLQVELSKAKGGKSTLALALLIVDRLSEIQSLLGSALMNQVLCQFVERVKKCLRPEDVLVRGPGHEFWVVMPLEARGPLGLKTMAETSTRAIAAACESMRAPFEVDEQKIQLVIAGGVCCSQGQEEMTQVIDRARLAATGASGSGGNRLVHFQLEMEKPVRKRLQQAPLLRQALYRGQFELRFQPIVELKTGMIKGVESLLRWNHPVDGVLEAGHFLGAACESGVIVGIGDWVMHQVCDLSKIYRQIYWSINVSAQELMQADFVKRLLKAIEKAKLSRAEFIVIEVSEEQLAANNPRLDNVLKDLRNWKVQLAIDDFSFDSCSIKRLQSHGVNYVKLSHAVTHNLDQVLVRNLVRGAVLAADSMGAKVVAKGIENQGQLDLALENGCHWGQGHLLSLPLTWAELEDKLPH